jgi:hypothetical protein
VAWAVPGAAERRDHVLDRAKGPAFGLLIVGQRRQAQGDAEGQREQAEDRTHAVLGSLAG